MKKGRDPTEIVMMSVRDEDYRKIFWIGLSVMFVLIGISTVIDAFIRPQTTVIVNYFGWVLLYPKDVWV
ncbi:MAG: hypothetical protein M1442_00205 [Candidatus Thermoplasmatota archaeon]|nr:hypothetical protein [Candidatus Thermoplasmatota archaeon]